MKFDPPLLSESCLTGCVYVVTHGKREPHPTILGEEMITASVKYDVTDQFEALVARRSSPLDGGFGGSRGLDSRLSPKVLS